MKRRSAKSRRPGPSPLAWLFINDEPLPDIYDGWELFVLQFNYLDPETHYRTQDLWQLHGDSIIRQWVKDKPGTRPSCWWRFSAPEPRRDEPEADYLARHGLLTNEEKKEIVR